MPKYGFNKVTLQITLRRRCFPVNLLYISGTSFCKNTSGGLLLALRCTPTVSNNCHFSCIVYLSEFETKNRERKLFGGI